MTAATVTKKQALNVLEAVKALFPGQESEFTLYDADHEEMAPGTWSIAAEGVLDPITDCWPMRVLDAAFEARTVPGHPLNAVYLDARTSWSLGIYPND